MFHRPSLNCGWKNFQPYLNRHCIYHVTWEGNSGIYLQAIAYLIKSCILDICKISFLLGRLIFSFNLMTFWSRCPDRDFVRSTHFPSTTTRVTRDIKQLVHPLLTRESSYSTMHVPPFRMKEIPFPDGIVHVVRPDHLALQAMRNGMRRKFQDL